MSQRSSLPVVQLAGTILTFLTAGCVVQPPSPVRYATVLPAHVAPAAPPVVSVYVEPPLYQPPPIAVAWAPPPMLVETPPPLPFAGAIWTGGYWTWQGNWVWAAGRWAAPPQPGYSWVQPYYEHRNGAVVFITGHWSPPGIAFVPPPLGLSLTVAAATVGVVAGMAPIGPQGVFVPAPPGSRPGLIVPAPIGTPPAVVVSAPPVTNVGMRVQNTTINNVSNTTNVTNINNTRTVTVLAPASATASGRPFEAAVPASAHLAAALPPVVRTMAPVPASVKPVAAFMPVHQHPVAAGSPEAAHAAAVATPPVSAAQAQARPQAALSSMGVVKRAEPEPLAAPARPNAEPPKKAMPAIDEPRPSRADPELLERARLANAQRIASEQERSHSHPPKQGPAPRARPVAPPHAHAEPRPAPRKHAEPPRKEEH